MFRAFTITILQVYMGIVNGAIIDILLATLERKGRIIKLECGSACGAVAREANCMDLSLDEIIFIQLCYLGPESSHVCQVANRPGIIPMLAPIPEGLKGLCIRP